MLLVLVMVLSPAAVTAVVDAFYDDEPYAE